MCYTFPLIHNEKMTDIPIKHRFGHRPDRRTLIKIAAGILLAPVTLNRLTAAPAPLFRIKNRYSKLNRTRPQRQSTRYIVLHTTEGAEVGALDKVIRYGEANYFVSNTGIVYRIIDKKKIAKHTGRSMWEGLTTIDNYSIGIEVVGYHNKDIKDAQYDALRELLRQLQSLYDIPDDHVLTHSMVAYGRPNRFHQYNHRGRKRCGMIFAQPEVRARLGLDAQPEYDPDVKAGRLKVADKKLFRFLFPDAAKPTLVAAGKSSVSQPIPKIEIPQESFVISGSNTAWEIARERYNHHSTLYTFPNGSKKSGDQITNWARIPVGTRVTLNEMEDPQQFEGFLEIGKDGDTAETVAGDAYKSRSTIYFFPDGYIRTGAELQDTAAGRGLLKKTPQKTLLLVGYIYGGYVKARRPASSIAGKKWNYPSTYYRYPDGTILSGDDINQRSIPANTLIFYQQ
ncbi:MAG: peptidoglycan recognition family protein [Acidobacteriota bacterium]|jgi:N-acetylmuramoyl-L-alanine amidase